MEKETRKVTITRVTEAPDVPKTVLVEAVLMPNGEVISGGKTIYRDDFKYVYLMEKIE